MAVKVDAMQHHGPLTIEQWQTYRRLGHYLHVYLDGVEVTQSCFFADSLLGIVCVYVRNAEGHIDVDMDTGEVKRVTRTGKVELISEPLGAISEPFHH